MATESWTSPALTPKSAVTSSTDTLVDVPHHVHIKIMPHATSEHATTPAGTRMASTGSDESLVDDLGVLADTTPLDGGRTKDGSLSIDQLKSALGEIGELDNMFNAKQKYLNDLVRKRHDLERASGSNMALAAPAATAADKRPTGSSSSMHRLAPKESAPTKNEEARASTAFLTQLPGADLADSDDDDSEVDDGMPQFPPIPRPKIERNKDSEVSSSIEHLVRIQRIFDQGSNNFITRNKELGPEARYYSALTPKEQDRVDQIMQDDSDEDVAGSGADDGDDSSDDGLDTDMPYGQVLAMMEEEQKIRAERASRDLANPPPTSDQ
ncbi:hypothetical protein H9P43_000425 [Blastocladiella emersonii ATCC 22665]|nr:hypothetical protein H9P43_000425 [Blastocladiella emersonii ATCC 22665]